MIPKEEDILEDLIDEGVQFLVNENVDARIPLDLGEIGLSMKNAIFEGKVSSKYGTYVLQHVNYARSLKVDLIDREGVGAFAEGCGAFPWGELIQLLLMKWRHVSANVTAA